MSSSINVDKLASEIMKGLHEYANLTDVEMKKAVRKTATTIKKNIQLNAPTAKGKYRKSWTSSKTFEKAHVMQITIYSKNRYWLAHLLENGHARRGGGRNVDGCEHIKPAEDMGEEMLENLIKKAL